MVDLDLGRGKEGQEAGVVVAVVRVVVVAIRWRRCLPHPCTRMPSIP
jgi:hypothetical protein